MLASWMRPCPGCSHPRHYRLSSWQQRARPLLPTGQVIDGKSVRGVGRAGHSCLLASLVEHVSASVLAQEQVSRKRDERSAVPVLLAQLDLRNTVITHDALHTLKPTARLIHSQGGDYLMVVKKNQRGLYEFLDMLFSLPAHPSDHEVWDQVGPTSEKGRGRLETPTLISGNAHIEDVDWPGVAQVIRRECERIELKTGKVTREVSYGLTSLAPSRADAAAVEALWRGHWTIENRVHYVRDVSFGEGAGHAAIGSTARGLASVRNALLYLFRRAGWRSVPDALAHFGAAVRRALSLVGLNANTSKSPVHPQITLLPSFWPIVRPAASGCGGGNEMQSSPQSPTACLWEANEV